MRMHPIAWSLWVLGAAASSLLSRNPLYQALLALSAWLVMATAGSGPEQGSGWRGLLRFGAVVWLVTIPFSALMYHEGRTVLFRLPSHWPLVGGNITLEAVLFGASSGLVLWTLLSLFAAYNTAVDASELVRLAPPVFYQASIIISIGLTFVPQMVKSSQEIREAQRVRGHRFRSWRDLTPLVMPLLTTSLERAMMLAESMEARGFGAESSALPSRERLTLSLLMLTGLALLLSGLGLNLWWRQGTWWVRLMLAAAVGCIVYALASMAHHTKRSRYNRQRWQLADSAVAAGSLASIGAIITARVIAPQALAYYPFPPAGLLPAFNPWLGAACALFALPAVILLLREPSHAAGQPTSEASP